MKRRLKKPVIYAIYVLTFVSVFGSIVVLEKTLEGNNTFNEPDNYNYVSETIFDNVLPVIAEEKTIIRPYTASDVSAVKHFYDYKGTNESQEKSLLYYENTYLQNSGTIYSGPENFDVVTIMDGTVTKIKEDNILGKIIEIRHTNGAISVYQSLSDILVSENQEVKQGDIIAKSGTNNISKEIGDHLYFELIINGQNVNPEEYYNKKVSEI